MPTCPLINLPGALVTLVFIFALLRLPYGNSGSVKSLSVPHLTYKARITVLSEFLEV